MCGMDYQKYQSIPNNLRQCRKDRGLRQEQVAAALSLKNKTLISRWERGRAIPNLINVLKLCDLYEVSITDLFGDLIRTIHEMNQLV